MAGNTVLGKSTPDSPNRFRWQSPRNLLDFGQVAVRFAPATECARNSYARRNRETQRRGFTIVEMLGTCLLLAVLFGMTVPMLLLVAQERRSTEQRQFALQHAANLLEHAIAMEPSEWKEGELSLPDADADLKEILPGLERTLIVKPAEDEREPQQITASIRWRNRAGDRVAPLRLSAWVHPLKEVP